MAEHFTIPTTRNLWRDETDTIIASSRQEAKRIYEEHHGNTHFEMTGEEGQHFECVVRTEEVTVRYETEEDAKAAAQEVMSHGAGRVVCTAETVYLINRKPWTTFTVTTTASQWALLPAQFLCSTGV